MPFRTRFPLRMDAVMIITLCAGALLDCGRPAAPSHRCASNGALHIDRSSLRYLRACSLQVRLPGRSEWSVTSCCVRAPVHETWLQVELSTGSRRWVWTTQVAPMIVRLRCADVGRTPSEVASGYYKLARIDCGGRPLLVRPLTVLTGGGANMLI